MKKQLTFFLLLIVLSISAAAQSWTAITSNRPAGLQQELISSTNESIVIRFNVPGFFMRTVETPRGRESIISVPEMVPMLVAGTPDIPQYGVSAIIPDMALMQVRVISSKYTDFTNIDVAPSKGNFNRGIDPNTVPFIYGEVYNHDAFYPAIRSELQEPYILRDFRGQVVTIFPFSYNPIARTLRVYHEMTVEMYNTGIGGENQFHRSGLPERTDREFKHLYDRHFINFSVTRYPIIQEEGRMLIISHGPFMAAMEEFVQWRRTIGRPTEMVNVATIGTTSTAIKNFVVNYYNTHGLTHLLLVGDHQQIPSHSMSGGFSDNFFGYITGNDSYNELFVGRFSAETPAHVTTHVDRIIHYERDITTADTWLNFGIGIARNEGAGQGHYGESDFQHMDFIRDTLLNFTYSTVYREYDGNVPGLPNTTAAQISQRINAGASIINFCNHGSVTGWSVANYSISHVNQLTNVNKWPWIWSVACDNGRFTTGTCFAEVWMRATHNTTGEPTGAIGTMMSWISQPWVPPMTGQDEMVTIFAEGYANRIKRTFGGTSIHGSMRMVDQHGTSGRETHDTWILFGDPSLTLRSDIPTPITVSHMPAILLGSSTFTVNANAEDAIVSITMNGQILGTAYINNGTATVNFAGPLNQPGEATIAVFGFNRVTYLEEVDVIPATGPYIVYVSRVINDTLTGNGNGQIDFDESLVLGVSLKNLGVLAATDAIATISSISPFVTLTDSVHSFGTIEPGATLMISDAFAFDVADNVPNNTTLTFSIIVTSGTESWTGSFNLVAYAPVLAVGNYSVSDPTGNSNGRLDPGETANIIITTANNGQSDAINAIGSIVLSDNFITVNSATYTIPIIGAGQTVNAVFNVTVSPSTPIGHAASFSYSVQAGAYQAQRNFIAKIGLILEDFETGDFSMFNWAFSGNQPWTIVSSGVYEGAFSARSGTVSHGQESVMSLQYEVGVADSISFFRSVSSESAYDFLRFYINNVKVGEWSGNVPWGRVAFPVSAGMRTFRWEYSKDGSLSNGSDCGWIDYIVFPPMLVATSNAGTDGIICQGATYQLNGAATNFHSFFWTTSGDGVFSNSLVLNPVYTPGTADINNGGATLTLTVVRNTTTITDHLVLTINRLPVVTAGVNSTICDGSVLLLENASASFYSELLWTTSGTGSFNDPTILNPTYTPSSADIAAGNVTLTLQVVGMAPCGDAAHSIIVNIVPQPQVFAGNNINICRDATVQLQASASNYSALLWTTSGTGSFNDNMILNPIYTPSANDIAAGNVTLTLSAAGLAPCANAISAVNVQLMALPTAELSGNHTICLGQSAPLTFNLTGTAPWVVVDGNNVTHTITESPWVWNVSPETTTTFTLMSVTDANNCTNAATGSAIVTVNLPPLTPVKPAGPDTVDFVHNTSSVFTIEPVANTTGYLWSIEPAEAGTVSPDGTSATVAWNATYQGNVVVKARAWNDCGEGEWSDHKQIHLKNTTGIGHIAQDWNLNIYPNPSQGMFTLTLTPTRDVRANITVTSLIGKVVYSEQVALGTTRFTKTVDLNQLESGLYILSVEGVEFSVFRKIIIRR